MPNRADRRRFLKTAAAAGMGYWLAGGLQAKQPKSPNERIAIASIGVRGKGQDDTTDAANHGDLVAVCDVDANYLGAAGKEYPKAKQYRDFRKMLDEMGKSIDAVTVSTPDHSHGPAALMAMRMGKHCFCQKPLSHSIYEARLMAQVAREQKVATQMGNHYTADNELRKAAAVVRSGALGPVQEVHVWTNRPRLEQGIRRPAPKPCPAHLRWDLWLSAAPARPFANGYHPSGWRVWWDFGSGALGDMACHTMNMPYMALNLRNPTTVQAETAGHNRDSFPRWSKIVFDFPELDGRPALKLFWYDGGRRPDMALFEGRPLKPTGCLVIGEKGKLYSPGDYGEQEPQLLGRMAVPDVKWVRSPGHFEEWIRAIRGGEPAAANFPDYAGPLTETVLLGNLAVWVAGSGRGERLEWDAKEMESPNLPGLESVIRPAYRPGYTLDV